MKSSSVGAVDVLWSYFRLYWSSVCGRRNGTLRNRNWDLASRGPLVQMKGSSQPKFETKICIRIYIWKFYVWFKDLEFDFEKRYVLFSLLSIIKRTASLNKKSHISFHMDILIISKVCVYIQQSRATQSKKHTPRKRHHRVLYIYNWLRQIVMKSSSTLQGVLRCTQS